MVFDLINYIHKEETKMKDKLDIMKYSKWYLFINKFFYYFIVAYISVLLSNQTP